MGAIDVINGILIYLYGFDHNPPHIHIVDGEYDFSIEIKSRIVEGKGRSKTIKIINKYIDDNEKLLLELFEKAQRGEEIKRIVH